VEVAAVRAVTAVPVGLTEVPELVLYPPPITDDLLFVFGANSV
jgi:hypothetical protein